MKGSALVRAGMLLCLQAGLTQLGVTARLLGRQAGSCAALVQTCQPGTLLPRLAA